MKRFLVAVIMISIFLCGCNVNRETVIEGKMKGVASSGVWFSFSEINQMLSSENGFENEVIKAAENCKDLGIQNVYIHIRSYCDSLFKSDYFPLISAASDYSGDAFKFITDTFHNYGIKVHAWINPYRVLTSSSDIEALNQESPAYKWLKDENTDNDINVCIASGIYLNPASNEVQRLVIDGIREVLEKYPVDGIHFDDYFYPTTDSSFDKVSFEKYKSSASKPLDLADWRRLNVNSLISGCYTAIKNFDKDIIFSISPAASVENNYENLYADIKEWVKNGYIDAIIPQIYFGFDYPLEEYRFKTLFKEWEEIAKINTDVSLLIGLASYKIGTDIEADKTEWQTDESIIAKQAKMCYESSFAGGYVLFSYTSLFSEEELNTKQRDNLKEFCKQME